MEGYRRYVPSPVGLCNEIFDTGELSQASRLVGMPLILCDLGRGPALATSEIPSHNKWPEHYWRNSAAQKLMVRCHKLIAHVPEENIGLLQTPLDWRGKVGSVVVVRQDRKPLCPQHVKILVDFLDKILQLDRPDAKAFFAAMGESFTNQDAVDMLTPGNFKDYYMARKLW